MYPRPWPELADDPLWRQLSARLRELSAEPLPAALGHAVEWLARAVGATSALAAGAGADGGGYWLAEAVGPEGVVWLWDPPAAGPQAAAAREVLDAGGLGDRLVHAPQPAWADAAAGAPLWTATALGGPLDLVWVHGAALAPAGRGPAGVDAARWADSIAEVLRPGGLALVSTAARPPDPSPTMAPLVTALAAGDAFDVWRVGDALPLVAGRRR